MDDWLVDCLDVWREGGGGGGVETWSSRCKGTIFITNNLIKLKFEPCVLAYYKAFIYYNYFFISGNV